MKIPVTITRTITETVEIEVPDGPSPVERAYALARHTYPGCHIIIPRDPRR